MSELKTCSLCGYELDGKGLRPCDSCPMDSNCQVVCCPNCGYGQVDVEGSTLVKWFTSIFGSSGAPKIAHACCSLDEVAPGLEVRVRGYGELPPRKLEQLQAYGLVVGRQVKVLQQEPLTVVLADHTELALESPIAKEINVELRQESG